MPSSCTVYLPPLSHAHCPPPDATCQVPELSWHRPAHLASPLPGVAHLPEWLLLPPRGPSTHVGPLMVPASPSRMSGVAGSLEKEARTSLELWHPPFYFLSLDLTRNLV